MNAIETRFRFLQGASIRLAPRLPVSRIDAYGRVIARVDPFVDAGDVLVTQVETGRVGTPYPALGDWFGWSRVAALIVLAIASA